MPFNYAIHPEEIKMNKSLSKNQLMRKLVIKVLYCTQQLSGHCFKLAAPFPYHCQTNTSLPASTLRHTAKQRQNSNIQQFPMPPPRAKSKSSSIHGAEAPQTTKEERNRERERSRGKHRSSSRGNTRGNVLSKSNRNSNGTRQPESSQRHEHHRSTGDAPKRYVYSAISATFFFLLFRELGWIQQNNDSGTSTAFNLKGTNKISHLDAESYKSSKALTIALAGTSSAGGMQNKFNLKTQSPKQHMTRQELMKAITELDGNYTQDDNLTSHLPIIYTFFEWIPPRNRGTQMSDQADLGLMAEWKSAWRKAGWNPKVLTLDDAKRHASYETYAPELNKIQMLGVDGMGGNVVYNQLW